MSDFYSFNNYLRGEHGHMAMSIAKACQVADLSNLAKLAVHWPDIVAAYHVHCWNTAPTPEQIRAEVRDSADSYNGWPNWETWAVHLHLSNDQSLYEMTRKVIKWAQDTDGVYPEGAVRDWLIDYVETVDPKIDSGDYSLDPYDTGPQAIGLLRSDLIGRTLREVDWYAIVDAFTEEDN